MLIRERRMPFLSYIHQKYFLLQKLSLSSTTSTRPTLHELQNVQQLDSLKRLLSLFTKAGKENRIEYKQARLSRGNLNYIEINKQPLSSISASASASASTSSRSTLFLLHGFGSGLGFFFANYDALSSKFDRVVAIDWLGMGFSERTQESVFSSSSSSSLSSSSSVSSSTLPVSLPKRSALSDMMLSILNDKHPYPNPNQSNSSILKYLEDSISSRLTTPTQATDFFIDSLQEFIENDNKQQQQLQIQLQSLQSLQSTTSNHNDNSPSHQQHQNQPHKFVLAGHSLGGYLVGRYAHKYPDNLSALIFISPVGIDRLPLINEVVKTSVSEWRLYMMKLIWHGNITPQVFIYLYTYTIVISYSYYLIHIYICILTYFYV